MQMSLIMEVNNYAPNYPFGRCYVDLCVFHGVSYRVCRNGPIATLVRFKVTPAARLGVENQEYIYMCMMIMTNRHFGSKRPLVDQVCKATNLEVLRWIEWRESFPKIMYAALLNI